MDMSPEFPPLGMVRSSYYLEFRFKSLTAVYLSARQVLNQAHVPAFRVLWEDNGRSRRRGFEVSCIFREMQIFEGRNPPVANNSEAHDAQKHCRHRLESDGPALKTP